MFESKLCYSNETILPNGPTTDPIRTPAVAEWLNNVALRDLQFHHTHAACVDARGDVYQWGNGFFGKAFAGVRSPKRTLRGKVFAVFPQCSNLKANVKYDPTEYYTASAN